MRNLFIIFSLPFLFSSIAGIAFEDSKEDNNIKLIYKLNANLDDLVLNYCTTYDSYTVNRLYSQKKIIDDNSKYNSKNKFFVSLKKKPINPSKIKFINEDLKFKTFSQNINDVDLSFLSESKKKFVKTLLPLISYENQSILFERSKLENIRIFLNDNNTLSSSDLKFLEKISKKYRLKMSGKHKYDLVNELLNLVDVIPNSIVLAQAANESGWGTSRFATEFNALFGEYTYNYKDGVVPLLREKGEKHLVKAFESVDKSVQSYFINLNSHHAYEDFRKVRKVMRQKNNFHNISLLVEELDSYAADENYISTINSIIDVNKLNNFNNSNYSINKS